MTLIPLHPPFHPVGYHGAVTITKRLKRPEA